MTRMYMLQNCGERIEGFCLVKSAQQKTDSKGNLYLDMVLGDAGGECVAKIWNYSEQTYGHYETEDIVKVRGTLNYYKDTEQLKIEKIRHAADTDTYDMRLLVPCAPINPEEIYAMLYTEAECFTDTELGRLIKYLLDTNKKKLLYYPAAVKLHHAYRSGLLYHTYSVFRLSKAVSALYPELDGELITAGAILHDIGKVYEMDTGSLGIAGAYTAEGSLIGHIQIGVDILRSAAQLLDTPQETVMLLEHMLLSHHGVPEFGSPKYPMFPEAEVLSECDLLDSRLFEMFDALKGVVPGGFTERQWALDNRQLYKRNRTDKQ